ncbi:hypothetical protein C8R48DRAFT_679362 [Suillus tomentosus]|nr:hypothetical protein C8R48DRAFT_679362 [Suillus tomentosus]
MFVQKYRNSPISILFCDRTCQTSRHESAFRNHLLWNKPARQHIEAWGVLGNDGWTWEKFQMYSKKSERWCCLINTVHDTDVLKLDATLHAHGEHGAVVTSFPPVISNLDADFRKAMEAHNIPTIILAESFVLTFCRFCERPYNDSRIALSLSVGMNVQEHLYTGVTFELTDHFAGKQENITSACGKGSLNPNTVDTAFVALADISPELDAKVIAALQSEDKDAGLAAQYKYRPSIFGRSTPAGVGCLEEAYFALFATNCPLSRGTAHVTSKDSLEPHGFENRFDLDTMVELVNFCRRLAQTSPLEGEGEGRLKDSQTRTAFQRFIPDQAVEMMPPSQVLS